jgi:hypothetical protein
MYEGSIVREVSGRELTEANLVSAAVGVTESHVADVEPDTEAAQVV